MTKLPLILGAPEWISVALALFGAAALAILWNYTWAASNASRRVRVACSLLKAIGVAALVLCLLEPLLTGSKPKSGANAFVVLADNSQSLGIRDDNSQHTRGDWIKERLAKESPWKTRLGQDFDVRNYLFDSHLRGTEGFGLLTFDGEGSALTTSLASLSRRFRGLPLAGVLLFTDGNRTDTGDIDTSQLPPIYPVALPAHSVLKDVSVHNVSISQTNFESAPVVLRADVTATGLSGETIVAAVSDETGKDLERQEAVASSDGKPLSFRFQFRPEHQGVSFYQVRAYPARDEEQVKAAVADPKAAKPTREQTLANNSRLVVVDQGSEAYRVLYVTGRPNWEYKYLRRAIDDDRQVELVGLLRIARRQPKFDFRDPRDPSSNRFFQGFDNPDADTAERSDQPVLVRIGTLDEVELRDGFPKTAEELYRYHAIIVDDLEAAFFTQDQLTLLRSFVAQRGGGFLMLGGPDSFASGKYDRTPLGDILPVYLNNRPAAPEGLSEYQLVLTREGWLQPWVRMRKTEEEEQQRLNAMPAFQTLSRVGTIKPGAVVLAELRTPDGKTLPGLVAQQFGKGHVAALTIGDLWRWGLKREKPEESDLERSWRQTVRWLVADVPGRVELSVRPKPEAPSAVTITVRVRDAEYRPLDNAKVALKISHPGNPDLQLDAEAVGNEAGTYTATYVAKQPGPYRVSADATAPDGSAIGEAKTGWAAQPSADEFARLEPDREFLKTLAAKTQGEVVDGNHLESFVKSLSTRKAPVNEPWTSPLWHQPIYFLIAIACLTAEWGLRRVNGLA